MSSKNIIVEPYRPIHSFIWLIGVITVITLSIIYSEKSKLTNNWADVKCNPFIIPFTSIIAPKSANITTKQNFTDCISKFMKEEIDSQAKFLNKELSSLKETSVNTNKDAKTLHESHQKTKGLMSKLLGDINQIFVNLLLSMKKDALIGKSIIHKFSGLVTSILYIIQGGNLTGTSFLNGPIYKIIKKIGGCFHKNTKIKLENGRYKKISKLKMDDVLDNGKKVICVMKIKNKYKEPFYTLKNNADILVTGSHLILDQFNNRFVPVNNHRDSLKTIICDDVIYNLLVEDHLIKMNNYTFWDYDD